MYIVGGPADGPCRSALAVRSQLCGGQLLVKSLVVFIFLRRVFVASAAGFEETINSRNADCARN